MATIHKRRLRSGRVVWELTHGTGADRQRFIAGQTREEAQTMLRQFDEQLALHGSAPHDDTVTAVVASYLGYLRTNRRPGTVRRYARVLKTFTECFLPRWYPDVQRLRQLRPVHFEEYKRRRAHGGIEEPISTHERAREQALHVELAQRPFARTPRENARFGWLGRKKLRSRITARTVNYELQVLHTFCHWAVRHNQLITNPVSVIERFRISKRALPKFLSADDLRTLFMACDEDERRLFMTIVLTGMRKGEIEYLTWSDVNFDMGVLLVQEKPDLGWKPKTDERVIPMSEPVRQLLTMQHQHRVGDRFVFANKAGHRDTHILQKLRNACRRAGISPATVHALRHSFGAHLRMAGASLADIADLLGHKDLATTSIYAKVHQQHLRDVMTKLTSVVDEQPVRPAAAKTALPHPSKNPT